MTDPDLERMAPDSAATTLTVPAPSIDEVTRYLGPTSYTEPEIAAVLLAERSAQAASCRVPDDDVLVWPADLAEALYRRVARNLALRGIPLAVLQGDAEVGSLIPPGRDPEVRRLEAPHRRLVVG